MQARELAQAAVPPDAEQADGAADAATYKVQQSEAMAERGQDDRTDRIGAEKTPLGGGAGVLDAKVDGLGERVTRLEVRVDEGFRRVDDSFKAVDKRFEQVDKRFERVDANIGELRQDMKAGFSEQQRELVVVRSEMNTNFRHLYLSLFSSAVVIVVGLIGSHFL